MFENSMDQVDQGIYTPQHPDGIVFAGSSLVRAAWRFGVFEEMDTGEWPPKNMCILCEKNGLIHVNTYLNVPFLND